MTLSEEKAEKLEALTQRQRLEQEQDKMIKESTNKIFETLNVSPTLFIPPENSVQSPNEWQFANGPRRCRSLPGSKIAGELVK